MMGAENTACVQPSIADALGFGRQLIGAVDARLLLREVLACTAVRLAAYPEQRLGKEQWASYQALVRRREKGEPVAYILGRREFFGHSFKVSPAVLIPRPETELLVGLAVDVVQGIQRPRIVDLGTGSGVIAISIALELAGSGASVLAVDLSADALAVARENGQLLGAEVDWRQGGWYDPVIGERFDCIVSNPPYICLDDHHLLEGDLRFEPSRALSSGADGLDDLRKVIGGASAHLNADGWLFVEHGYDQAVAVQALLRESGFEHVSTRSDLAGIPRVSCGQSARS